MKNRFLAVAMMAWTLGAGLASAHADDQPQPEKTEQQQMASTNKKEDATREAGCPISEDNALTAAPDTDAPQNQVEYGGGA